MALKFWNSRIARFLLVGVFNTTLDLIILNSLVFYIKLPALVANLFSATTSISVSFFLNHYFVFKTNKAPTYSRFFYFFAVTGIGILVVQSLVILLITHLLGSRDTGLSSALSKLTHHSTSTKFINLNIAKLCAVLVAMCWNFCLYRLVIFKETDADEIMSTTSLV